MTASPTASFARLDDGRLLAYYEFGAATGRPCIYTTGTPASGLAGAVYHEAALAAGVRWISVDKPGYGQSDLDPRRSLLRYAADIRQLADALGLDRFANAGESGGGPHALAVAHVLPERLTCTLVLAGMGPGHEKWVREGMKPMNRRLFAIAQRAPWALRLPMAQMSRTLKDPVKRKRFEEAQLAVAPPADRRAAEQLRDGEAVMRAACDAFRNGGRGAAQEMAMFARPWGFSLSDITGDVEIWHGTEDVNVPIGVAARVAEEVPGARARFFEHEGHSVGSVHAAEVMNVVVAAAEGSRV